MSTAPDARNLARLVELARAHQVTVARCFSERRRMLTHSYHMDLLFVYLREALQPLHGLLTSTGEVSVMVDGDSDRMLRLHIGDRKRSIAYYCVVDLAILEIASPSVAIDGLPGASVQEALAHALDQLDQIERQYT